MRKNIQKTKEALNVSINFAATKTVKNRMIELAAKAHMSPSSYMRYVVDEWLSSHRKGMK